MFYGNNRNPLFCCFKVRTFHFQLRLLFVDMTCLITCRILVYICTPTGFLQCFDTVGLVIWPVKIVPEMTYNVLSGTLDPTHSLTCLD